MMMFLGSLVVKYFSRQREFKADALAAERGNRGYMIAALKRAGGGSPCTATGLRSFQDQLAAGIVGHLLDPSGAGAADCGVGGGDGVKIQSRLDKKCLDEDR